MKRSSLRYILLTSRLDQLWFPLAFWALFLIIGVLRGQPYVADTARAYLGSVVPLIGGILAGHAVLEDPALELRFATPIPAAQTLLERLGPAFVVQAFCVFTFQGLVFLLHDDLSLLGGWVDVQLAWLLPTLSLTALGCFVSLAAAQTVTGALLVGMVWLVELVARSWFAANRIGRYLLIFMGSLMPGHPATAGNRLGLFFAAIVFFAGGWTLLRRQERYI